MDKEDVVHIYNAILLSHKKEQNIAIYNNMDGPRDYCTRWSKSKRERQIPYDITYIWNLKDNTNEHIYKTETDRHREQRRGCGGRKDWELGISRCKLYI